MAWAPLKSNRRNWRPFGLARVIALAVVLAPLGACSTITDMFGSKDDDNYVEEPAAKRYVTLHPGSQDAAYAQFLIGSSYFDRIPDISRDQDRTEKAVAELQEVVRKFPNTEYAISAKK